MDNYIDSLLELKEKIYLDEERNDTKILNILKLISPELKDLDLFQ